MTQWITPIWQVSRNVQAVTTTRLGGVSQPPYHCLNLAHHVGDLSQHVEQNRQLLQQTLSLPSAPYWLNQVHGTDILVITDQSPNQIYCADAVYTTHKNKVCAIMTADCLPVLFCSAKGNEIAAAHAGWRGLCNGILEKVLTHFQCKADEIIVWLGPAIGPTCFEVGEEVRTAFMAHDPQAELAFTEHSPQKYLANIYQLAKQRLQAKGVTRISGGEYCTMSDQQQFFSYRREKITGRMASLIWLD